MNVNFINSAIMNVTIFLRVQIIFYQYLPHLFADIGVIRYMTVNILLFGEIWHRKGLLFFSARK